MDGEPGQRPRTGNRRRLLTAGGGRSVMLQKRHPAALT